MIAIPTDANQTQEPTAISQDTKTKELQSEIERLKKDAEDAKVKAAAEVETEKSLRELEKLHANKELDMLKTQKDAILELFPKSTTEGLKGDITAGDKFGYLAEQVAYHSLNDISTDICKEIEEHTEVKNGKILIINDLQVAEADLPYFELITQFKLYDSLSSNLLKRQKNHVKDFEKILAGDYSLTQTREGFAAVVNQLMEGEASGIISVSGYSQGFAPVLPLMVGLSATQGIAGTVSSLASYFRTDYTIQGREFTMEDIAIIFSLAGALRSKKYNVTIANAFPLDEDDLENSDLIQKMMNLVKCSYKLTNFSAVFTYLTLKGNDIITRLTTEKEELIGRIGKTDPKDFEKTLSISGEISVKKAEIIKVQTWLQIAAGLIKEEGVINAEMVTFMKNYTTAATGQNFSKFVLAVVRDKVKKRLGITHFLYVHIVSRGGEAITMKKAFGATGDTGYIGGIVASFILMDTKGDVLSSGTYPCMHSFIYNLSTKDKTGPIKQIRIK